MTIVSWEFESPPLHLPAEIAQLVEHNLAKVGVASSSLVFRSIEISMTYMQISCCTGGIEFFLFQRDRVSLKSLFIIE